MSARAESGAEPPRGLGGRALHIERLAGVVLEVDDLAATEAFYEPIFQPSGGQWRRSRRQVAYRCGPQHVRFVLRRRPRTLSDSGQHQAYRLPRDHLLTVAQSLTTAGFHAEWWREDHPAERGVTAYFHDPSGNRVQLVASSDDGLLLEHAAIEVHDFNYCEYVYVTTLGGRVDYYHGWRAGDLEEAQQWAEGDDPCAPWTRRDNPHYRDFLVADPTGQLRPTRFSAQLGAAPVRPVRVPRPNGQVFVAYGDTRLGLIGATRVRQEPPEHRTKGTPRVVLATTQPAAEVEGHLSSTPIPFRREGRNIFLRDPDGNFAELKCG